MLADRADWDIMVFPLITAIAFTFYGVMVVIKYLHSPKGPTLAHGFPVVLQKKQ
jgi:hypothetical protein